MNIECPKCKTVFSYSNTELANKKFKCSVCNHIWTFHSNKKHKINKDTPPITTGYNILIALNLLIFLLSILVFFSFRENLETIDIYWKNIYLFFDALIPVQ